MAQVRSGSFRTYGYSDSGWPDHYVFSWELISQSTEGNYSDISWKLYGEGGATSGRFTKVKEKYVTVNGGTQSNAIEQITYNGTTPFSGTSRIYHNSLGEGSFSASAGGAFFYYGSYNSTGSGEWELPTIPRQANIVSAPDFNDEQNPTITYSNILGNNATSLQACISLTGASDDITYRDIPKTGTSYTFNLTEDERNILRNATTTSKSRSVIFFIKTEIAGTTLHSTMSKTLTITNASPKIGTFTYKDSNSTTTAITGNNQRIIRNNSNLIFTLGTATALKGASISKYEVTFNEVTKPRTSAGTLDFGAINLSNNATATLKVTDSRGNTATKQVTVIIDDWVLPTGLINLNRKNNFYSETIVKVDASYSSLNSKNIVGIQYQCKKVNDKNFTVSGNLEDNVETTIALDNEYQWYIEIFVTDLIGQTKYILNLDRGMPIAFFDRLRSSVGVNCFPTDDGSFEIDGRLIVNNQDVTPNKILNTQSNSQTDAYSCDYINKNFLIKYSEKEFLTNEYIGDKRVRGKRFVITDTISDGSAIPLNIENFDDVWIDTSNSYFKSTNGYVYPLSIVLYSGEQDRVCPYIFENDIKFHCDTSWGGTWTKVITIKYTKVNN